MTKYFLITIDTEGDDQWNTSHEISTENAKYLPRFQELCTKYCFKPVWLTNYEMANDPFFVEYMREQLDRGTCEIGMHIHAWNNPPEYPLKKVNDQRDYLIEYPAEIMEEKIKVLNGLLEDTFERKIVSHRSGRWALNGTYLKLLNKYGYLVDCSVTPHISWTKCPGSTGFPGSDYHDYPENPYYIYQKLLEIPMSVRKLHCFQPRRIKSIYDFLRECKRYSVGSYEWLRPDKFISEKGMSSLADKVLKSDSDCLMFMLHSSEMMPGGSNAFPTEESINQMFECIELIFSIISKNYIGITLQQYYNIYHNRRNQNEHKDFKENITTQNYSTNFIK